MLVCMGQSRTSSLARARSLHLLSNSLARQRRHLDRPLHECRLCLQRGRRQQPAHKQHVSAGAAWGERNFFVLDERGINVVGLAMLCCQITVVGRGALEQLRVLRGRLRPREGGEGVQSERWALQNRTHQNSVQISQYAVRD